jgi:hypothetical protein
VYSWRDQIPRKSTRLLLSPVWVAQHRGCQMNRVDASPAPRAYPPCIHSQEQSAALQSVLGGPAQFAHSLDDRPEDWTHAFPTPISVTYHSARHLLNWCDVSEGELYACRGTCCRGPVSRSSLLGPHGTGGVARTTPCERRGALHRDQQAARPAAAPSSACRDRMVGVPGVVSWTRKRATLRRSLPPFQGGRNALTRAVTYPRPGWKG